MVQNMFLKYVRKGAPDKLFYWYYYVDTSNNLINNSNDIIRWSRG